MPAARYRPPQQSQVDPQGDVGEAQSILERGVEGWGEAMRPHLMREIGNALGGLNSIGALRSGGANVALNDITTNYAQQIGAQGKQMASEALHYGLESRRIRYQEDERRRQRRAGLLRGVGMVLGAAAGFALGGPGGAALGATAAGGLGSSDASYNNGDLA